MLISSSVSFFFFFFRFHGSWHSRCCIITTLRFYSPLVPIHFKGVFHSHSAMLAVTFKYIQNYTAVFLKDMIWQSPTWYPKLQAQCIWKNWTNLSFKDVLQYFHLDFIHTCFVCPVTSQTIFVCRCECAQSCT